jgi:hypothetical protein
MSIFSSFSQRRPYEGIAAPRPARQPGVYRPDPQNPWQATPNHDWASMSPQGGGAALDDAIMGRARSFFTEESGAAKVPRHGYGLRAQADARLERLAAQDAIATSGNVLQTGSRVGSYGLGEMGHGGNGEIPVVPRQPGYRVASQATGRAARAAADIPMGGQAYKPIGGLGDIGFAGEGATGLPALRVPPAPQKIGLPAVRETIAQAASGAAAAGSAGGQLATTPPGPNGYSPNWRFGGGPRGQIPPPGQPPYEPDFRIVTPGPRALPGPPKPGLTSRLGTAAESAYGVAGAAGKVAAPIGALAAVGALRDNPGIADEATKNPMATIGGMIQAADPAEWGPKFVDSVKTIAEHPGAVPGALFDMGADLGQNVWSGISGMAQALPRLAFDRGYRSDLGMGIGRIGQNLEEAVFGTPRPSAPQAQAPALSEADRLNQAYSRMGIGGTDTKGSVPIMAQKPTSQVGVASTPQAAQAQSQGQPAGPGNPGQPPGQTGPQAQADPIMEQLRQNALDAMNRTGMYRGMPINPRMPDEVAQHALDLLGRYQHGSSLDDLSKAQAEHARAQANNPLGLPPGIDANRMIEAKFGMPPGSMTPQPWDQQPGLKAWAGQQTPDLGTLRHSTETSGLNTNDPGVMAMIRSLLETKFPDIPGLYQENAGGWFGQSDESRKNQELLRRLYPNLGQ